MNQDNHVELNRTFHQLSTDEGGESDGFVAACNLVTGKATTWDTLTKKYRIVLLAEAGAGKTQEIRQIAIKLRSEEKPAFFIRLEYIVDSFEISFEEGTVQEFNSWLESSEEGWVLLDSVDEAKLKNPKDFETAIRKISPYLSKNLEKTHLVITGRVSAWRTKTDLDLCNTLFSFEVSTTEANRTDAEIGDGDGVILGAEINEDAGRKGKKNNEVKFAVYSLSDLSRIQIEIFIKAKGLRNPRNFVDDINRHDAWKYTTRPQDLEDLVAYWKKNKRIGTHLELMQYSVKRRLTEVDQSRAHFENISSEKLLDGVQRVAAAVTFTHESSIGVLDGTRQQGNNIKDILPDWIDSECQVLLTRPIFDEAIYGTVRFHHRSVREYLTAKWLYKLLEKGDNRKSIESLVFRRKYGVTVVTPSMKPVLAWLVLFDEETRSKTCKIDLEVIFNCGDPSKLPKKLRCEVLRKICKNMSIYRYESATSYESVQRFANEDMADEIKSLLLNYSGDNNIIPFLVRMIWLGRISSLVDEAKMYALDSSTERYTRIASIRAVRDLSGGDECANILDSYSLNEAESIDRDVLSEIVEGLDPSKGTLEKLFFALGNVNDKEGYRSDALNKSLLLFVDKLSPDLMAEYLRKTIPLLKTEPIIEHRQCEVSTKYYWLIAGCLTIIAKLVIAKNANALSDESLTILSGAHVLKDYHDLDFDGISDELRELVIDWGELNRALFWKDVEISRRLKLDGSRLLNFWQVSVFGRFWEFDESCFDLIKGDITNQVFFDNKVVALSLAFQLYRDYGRPRKWREDLKRIVNGQDNRELQGRLNELLNPPAASDQEKKWKEEERKWKRRNKASKKREEMNRAKSIKWLSENANKLFCERKLEKGEIIDAHIYLLNKIRKDSSSQYWANADWKSLEPMFGAEVAHSFRDGVVYFWRHHKPALKSGKVLDDKSRSYNTILGLVGLEIESKEVDGWLDRLTEEEAGTACSYAFCELNGFPSWFQQLYFKFPCLVMRRILKEVKWELEKSTKEKELHYVISDIAVYGEWLWDDIAPVCIGLLNQGVANICLVEYLLKIVQGSSKICDEKIAEMARKNSEVAEDLSLSAIWYAVWIGVQPGLAIRKLSRKLASIDGDEDALEFSMLVLTYLVEGHHHRRLVSRDGFKKPEYLKRIHLLMHKYIRVKDDFNRANGGVYSPVLRDDAQEARGRLISILKDIPGKEAYVTLRKLAKHHPVEHSRRWVNTLARKKAEEDADMEPWGINKFVGFAKQCESRGWREMMKNRITFSERIAGCAFGAVFVIVSVFLAIFFPEPTPTQYATFKTILALSAAGVGGAFSGFIHVEGKIWRFTLRAGGAFALFIVVYFFTPKPPDPNEVINDKGNTGSETI